MVTDRTETIDKLNHLLESTPMTVSDIARSMWMTEKAVSRLLSSLVKDGLLIETAGLYSVPARPRKPRKPRSKPVKFSQVTLLKILLELIGVGASILSIRYTAIYLLTVLPAFWAWWLSAIMIVFSVMAFQVLVIFFKQKHLIAVIVFSILWVVIVIYSMGSTVIGQYNANKDTLNASIAIRNTGEQNNRRIVLLREDIIAVERQITAKQVDIDRFNRLLNGYDTIEKRNEDRASYNGLANAVWTAQEELKRLTANRAELSSELRDLIAREETVVLEEAPDFYDWIAELFGWRAAMVQFIISLLPALVIDIMAPLGIAVGMFLKEV